jgi:hypothetical protein
VNDFQPPKNPIKTNMKRPNITPGAWRIKSSNKTASLEIVGGEKYHHVALCNGKRQESHFRAQQANSRAIAALPALMAALEECLLRLENHDSQSAPECLQARAALIEAGYTFP